MNIHSRITESVRAGRPFCIVTVLSAEGSAPREAGTKALVDAEGRILGTVGGGLIEAEAQRAAVEACRSGRAAVLGFTMSGEAATGCEPICGGAMRLLVDPTARKDAAAYSAAAAAASERRRGLLVTVVRGGAPAETEVTWHPEDEVAAAGWAHRLVDREAARTCLADGRARLLAADAGTADSAVEVLVEPVIPHPRLLIAGGGHIGQALAAQALLVGFDVTVIDDRPEFTDRALFPEGVRLHCGDIAATLAGDDAGDDTYVVIVTRGHQHDAEALRACIRKPAAYVGMIGSRRKVALVRESFIRSGLATAEEFDAVHAPIGLDIGAETVPEIAASILAELIAVRRGGSAGRRPPHMRDR